MVYPTYYKLPHPDHSDGAKFTGFILVKDGENLADIMAARGIGEYCTDQPYNPPIHSLADRLATRKAKPTLDDLHSIMYLGYLGVASGVIDAVDLLSDTGFLHDIIHYMIDDKHESSGFHWHEMIVDRIRRLENAVPGWFQDVRGG